MSSVDKKCSICQTSLGNSRKPEVKLSCKHTFHRDCANLRFNNGKSKDCPICRKDSALEHALGGGRMPDNKQRGSFHDRTPYYDDNSEFGASAAKSKSRFSDAYGKDSDENGWKCSSCGKDNSKSLDKCKSCFTSKYSPSAAVHSSVASAIRKSHNQRAESYRNSESYDYHHSNFARKDGNDHHPPTNRQQRWNRPENVREWICDECEYVNQGSDVVCKNCREGKQSGSESRNVNRQFNRSPPPVHHSSPAASRSFAKKDDNDDNHPPTNRQQRGNRPENVREWICDECEYVNQGSDVVCKNCREGKQFGSESGNVNRQFNRTPPPVHHSSPAASRSSAKSMPNAYAEYDYDSHLSSQSDYNHNDFVTYSNSQLLK